MKFVNVLVSLWSVVLSPAFATEGGSTVGNGGDVVVCPRPGPGGVPALEMLDYLEARVHDGRTFPYRHRYRDAQERISEILNRAQALDPARAERYRTFAVEFLSGHDVEWSPIPLVDIPDSGHEVVPAGCSVQQLIIRRPSDRGSRRQFLVDRRLWGRMDSIQQAAAILHEAALAELLEAQPDVRYSTSARYVNGWWGSQGFAGAGWLEYLTQMREIAPFNVLPSPFTANPQRGPIPFVEITRTEDGAIVVPARYAKPLAFADRVFAVPGFPGIEITETSPVLVDLAGASFGLDWNQTLVRANAVLQNSGFRFGASLGGQIAAARLELRSRAGGDWFVLPNQGVETIPWVFNPGSPAEWRGEMAAVGGHRGPVLPLGHGTYDYRLVLDLRRAPTGSLQMILDWVSSSTQWRGHGLLPNPWRRYEHHRAIMPRYQFGAGMPARHTVFFNVTSSPSCPVILASTVGTFEPETGDCPARVVVGGQISFPIGAAPAVTPETMSGRRDGEEI